MISNNKIASTNIVLSILLLLCITYYYFYNQSPLQIGKLGHLGIWLTVPLSIINIGLGLKLMKNLTSNVSGYVSFMIAVIILIIALFSLFYWGSP
ncbi:hypothetical protein ABE61_19325 [Lysinibacillus sphaericus]|uniref:hypothetical protein n=1 Tax=Lysinibacillus sphaericus TaxID=1421 RepID=UPI0018CE4098|nr:hypothetical protein [Lysinibacillus sphaericus]MBG9456130.1 hypothetical protein [Lysinibacillus sphaericus]MBG9477493.1 hypothetical protein [Lysinibacillus sphaericus]MBG9593482.1 hypothetical protein [Lysinibacillus sphaericus]